MKKTLILVLTLVAFVYGKAQDTYWSNVEKVFGKKGTVTGDVFKIAFPRSDFKVKVGDFAVAPGLAFTSWCGMLKMGNEVMMMGDLVMLDSEEPTVMAKLVAAHLQVTAIHNHLVNETPAVKYAHYTGTGDPVKLAEALKSVFAVTATPLTPPAAQAQAPDIDWSNVTAVLGTMGKQNGVLLQYSFPRNEKLMNDGMEMPPAMGMATAINFQMDGNRAAITGDFVLLPDEVNAVLQALVENGITPTAIHNHMLHDEPRLFMMHFWAVDDPEKLAKGLKIALDKTNSKH